jgi:SAM-dependent methyltransferase
MHWIVLSLCVVVALVAVSPLLLRALLGVRPQGATSWRQRVELRYQTLETWTWMFARTKLRLDPMFQELPELIGDGSQLREVLDLGCGHGIAGCALLEWFGSTYMYGIEPRPARVAAAREALGKRGTVHQGAAPDFEWDGLPQKLDAVLALDMMHFLDDAAFAQTLAKIRQRLRNGAMLIMRIPMAPSGKGSWAWKIDRLIRSLRKIPATRRSSVKIQKMLTEAGFEICKVQDSGGNPELCWFIARADGGGKGTAEGQSR